MNQFDNKVQLPLGVTSQGLTMFPILKITTQLTDVFQ